MLNKKSKNAEVVAAFGKQLETGKPVIFGIEDTANPEYKTLCIAQTIETPGSATDEQELFLGWGNRETTVRCLQNVKVSQLPVLGQKFGKIEPGCIMPGANIRITEATEPRSWIGEDGSRVYQEAKIYPEGSVNAGKTMVTADTGQKIYRNTELVLGTPTHTFLQGVPAGSEAATQAENANTFSQLAGVEA